jgi:hypothetical protein
VLEKKAHTLRWPVNQMLTVQQKLQQQQVLLANLEQVVPLARAGQRALLANLEQVVLLEQQVKMAHLANLVLLDKVVRQALLAQVVLLAIIWPVLHLE